MQRCRFVSTSLDTALAMFTAAASMAVAPRVASAAATGDAPPLRRALADALRGIGSDKCLSAAIERESGSGGAGGIALYLRDAGIDDTGVRAMASALRFRPGHGDGALVALSLSYNTQLGDAGVVALARAFPPSLQVLGLVGCGLQDSSGQTLLEWATHKPQLREMCTEQNGFSRALRERFMAMGRARRGMLLVV